MQSFNAVGAPASREGWSNVCSPRDRAGAPDPKQHFDSANWVLKSGRSRWLTLERAKARPERQRVQSFAPPESAGALHKLRLKPRPQKGCSLMAVEETKPTRNSFWSQVITGPLTSIERGLVQATVRSRYRIPSDRRPSARGQSGFPPWHCGRASGVHQGVRLVVAGSVGKLNDGALALRGDLVRVEGQRLPALGREQWQLVVGPRRREVAALAIGQQSMRERAALIEGHHLDVAAAVVDVVATRIDGGLALRFQLVEHPFELISAVQRDLLTANDARFGDAHRHVDREARSAHDADGVAERLEDGRARGGRHRVEA